MSEACSNCRYHRDRENLDTTSASELWHPFECRRQAPTYGGYRMWPRVMADDWCGEWEMTDEERTRRAVAARRRVVQEHPF